MSRQTIALWGCGRIGRVTASLLIERGHRVPWLIDRDPAKSALLAQDLGQGRSCPASPEAQEHPEVDVVVDATGDATLLHYWNDVLKAQRASRVFFTRREPKADVRVMIGHAGDLPALPRGVTVDMGSCTGNALVPFISHLSRAFSPEELSCRVLHPLKQEKVLSLRSIETALENSLADWEPALADRTIAQSMELPVERGMALDLSVCFAQPVSKRSLESWIASLPTRCPQIQLSDAPPTSESIVGNPSSAVIDPGWRLVGNHLRLLLWQDNELGVSARIVDLLETLR